MGYLTLAIVVLVIMAVVNVMALAVSRGGAGRPHQALFWCGLVGLLALPVFVGSTLVLSMALIMATLNSPTGYLVMFSAAVGLISTLASVFWLAKVRTRNRTSHV